jgi:hypothetical protein
MTNEQLETELKHLATKEELQKELRSLSWKMVALIISVQIPTWTGIVGILLVLLTHK